MYFGIVEQNLQSPPIFEEVPTQQAVMFTQPATFHCKAQGYPQPTVQWYKDENVLEGKSGPALVFDATKISDRGFYHCVVTNSEGELTSAPAVLRLTDIRDYIVPVNIAIRNSTLFQGLSSDNSTHINFAIELYVSILRGLYTGNVIESQESNFIIHRITLFGGSVTTAVVPL